MEISTTSVATATAATAYGSRIALGFASLVRDDIEKWLSLTLGVEHRGAHGLRGRLSGPDHELVRRIITFAGVDRAHQHGLALRGGGPYAARQHQRLTVHDHAGMGPDIEMPDP